MKRIIAILTAAAMLLSFTACGNSDKPEEAETTTGLQNEQTTLTQEVNGTESYTTDSTETEESTGEETTLSEEESSQEQTTLSANPAEWSTEQIVEFYKAAARKSTHVTSSKTMTMNELVVNDGDGLLGALIEMAMPVLKSALKNNSTDFQGITGGYEKLSASDLKTAKAYKSGNYTVVEMTMIEQVDGIHGDANSGTVGHAISVVGDMAVIEENLPMFAIDFENSQLQIRYANPTLKVKINQNGVIEKGTWSYTVMVNIKNLYIENVRLPLKATIKTGHGSVAFDIKVGGGF